VSLQDARFQAVVHAVRVFNSVVFEQGVHLIHRQRGCFVRFRISTTMCVGIAAGGG
jgi:hypothetical protein